jgi:hypothetical protein
MSDAHVDALLGTLRTLVVTSVVAVAPRRAADAAAARVSQPLCAAAHRRVGARDCARGSARRAHRGARKRQRPDRLGARCRSASRRPNLSHRRARKTPLGSTSVCSSEPYNVPTWLLDVAQALAQHSSASSRVCRDAARRAASEFFRTRPRHRRARRDEAELLAACARRSTAPRTVGHANTIRLKSTEGQKSFVVSCSSAWKAPLACRGSSGLAASSDCLVRLFVALGTVSFACTGHSRAITGHKVAPINLVDSSAPDRSCRAVSPPSASSNPTRAGSQRLLFECIEPQVRASMSTPSPSALSEHSTSVCLFR